MSTEQKDMTFAEKIVKDHADFGRQFAPEFVSILAEQIAQMVMNRISEQANSEKWCELLDKAILLNTFAAGLDHGGLTEMQAAELFELVPETTSLIAELGGTFHNAVSCSYPRKSED